GIRAKMVSPSSNLRRTLGPGTSRPPCDQPSMPFFRSSEGGLWPSLIANTASANPFPSKSPDLLRLLITRETSTRGVKNPVPEWRRDAPARARAHEVMEQMPPTEIPSEARRQVPAMDREVRVVVRQVTHEQAGEERLHPGRA